MKPAILGLTILLAACGETDYQGRYTLTGVNGCDNAPNPGEFLEVRKTNEQYTAQFKGKMSNLAASANVSEFSAIPYSVDDSGNLPIGMEGDNGLLGVRVNMKLESTSDKDNFLLSRWDMEITNNFNQEVTKKNFLEIMGGEMFKGTKVEHFCLKRAL